MGDGDRDDRLAALEAELAAARRTIDVLMDRVEQPALRSGADRFALLKTVAHLQDEVRQASSRSERTAAHYRALYQQSPDAVLTLGPDGRVSDCNTMAERLFGRSRAEVRGVALSALLGGKGGAALTSLLWSGFAGVGDSDVGLEDGRRLSFSVARLDDLGWLLVLRDVTRQHELDRELTLARRLASVGRLAATVAHEINAPLSVLHGRLQLMRAAASADPGVQRQVQVAREQVGRIESLVRNLQTFAVHRAPRCVPVAAAEIFGRTRAAAAGRLRRLRVTEVVEPADLEVRADPTLLEQLLVNLVRQASERCPPGAELRLRASRVDGGVRLLVFGECPGLAPDLLEALRSPDSGRYVDPALGLHLAIAWAIAQDHGGWLTAENGRRGGVAFHVHLPDEGEPMQGAAPLGASRRILFVDDDHLLCETVTWMLTPHGHRVETASSAEEALDRLSRGRFDLIITDYRLPGMDGEVLAAEIAERWPELADHIVLTSGLLYTPRRSNAYLQKPFNQAQLLSLVRSFGAAPEAGGGQ